MSSSPLRPLAYPAQRQLSSTSAANPLGRSTGDASTSASSSVTAGGAGQLSKADQVVYRFYVKTVGVLVEGRLTHYASGSSGKTGEKKKDKWFNLSLPEVDLHNADLQIYRSVSTYNNPKSFLDESSIPPLLIAFILDTSDIPNGQALVWNRESGKYTVDNALLASGGPKGKGKETEQKNGIILERWTIRARNSVEAISASQMAPHTAYRLGIIHFRALYSLIRLLPAYRLFRRLRRINSGIRVGIKLWGPEGYPNTDEGLAEAWEVMERGLISLDTSLSDLVPSDQSPPDDSERCDLPPLDMFGTTYAVNVEYRPEVDFSVEDLESVLSERFVDMDEDWFKPTVARHRMEDEHGRGLPAEIQSNRRTSNPTAIPSTSPIPSRQQAATPQSFGSAGAAFSSGRPTGSRVASGVGTSVGKGSAGSRWGALGEGLPFAAPRMSGSGSEAPRGPPSPGGVTPSSVSGAAVTARRLSGHSIHPPMSSSPSTSLLRSTPPGVHPAPLMSRPSTSIGRTSSFLSQSGRSFTHAQLANMSPRLSSSPPVQTPVSPSSLSFTKQPVPRSFSGRQYAPTGSSSPFVPGSLEKDQVASTQSSLSAAPPMQVLKRYSSSLSQRPGVTVGSATSSEERALAGSIGASGGSATHNLLRRTSTRTSQESALRQSSIAPAPDHEDIQAFLKTLDALPHPPSLAAHAVHSSTRSHVPSTSSSLSTPSVPPSPLPVQNVSGSPGSMGPPPVPRAPLTRTLVDEALKRMAGSFDITTSRLVESTAPRIRTPDIGARPGPSTSSSGSAGPSVGLLTASRPTPPRTASRPDPPQSPENPGRPEYRRQNSVKTGSPLASSPAQLPLPESPSVNVQPSPRNTLYRLPSARSLPGSGSAALNPDEPLPRSAIPSMPSGFSGIGYSAASQTTGYGQGMATAESRTSRRGPVLLRGGFEGRSTTTGVTGSPGHGGHGRPSASSSPSHSPIRDFNRLTLSRPGAAAAGTPSGGVNPTTAPITGHAGFGSRGESMSLGYSTRKQPGQRTAPSSYGAEVDDADDRGRARRAARKSDGGPMGGEGARSGSEVDEGLGKEERVRPVHKRSGLSGDW